MNFSFDLYQNFQKKDCIVSFEDFQSKLISKTASEFFVHAKNKFLLLGNVLHLHVQVFLCDLTL